MYKVFTTNQNTLVLKGVPVAISNWISQFKQTGTFLIFY
jgi:hypothetical protein